MYHQNNQFSEAFANDFDPPGALLLQTAELGYARIDVVRGKNWNEKGKKAVFFLALRKKLTLFVLTQVQRPDSDFNAYF